MGVNSEDLQVILARKYLKMKIMEDNITFRGHEQQRSHVYDLMSRTVDEGESNSALIIGPRGSGKTTMVNSILWELKKKPSFVANSIVVQLHGLMHSDDKVALKAITTQMSLDNAVGDKVFGTFAENLAFLLSCLRSGADKNCRSVIFILEDFDLFCHATASQTLLYNLFDSAQGRQAPICVLGITCRLDVIELLEKRVKSRFSHRQIFIFPNDSTDLQDGDPTPFEERINLFTQLLSLPAEVKKPKKWVEPKKNEGNNANNDSYQVDSLDYSLSEFLIIDKNKKNKVMNKRLTQSEIERAMDISDTDDDDDDTLNDFEIPHDVLIKCRTDWREFSDLDPIFVSFWNDNVKDIAVNANVKDVLSKMYDIDVCEHSFRNILFQLVCRLSPKNPQLEIGDVLQVCRNSLGVDNKVLYLLSLSVLELSLVIAMKHQAEIFQDQPMNFEMILTRYTKFADRHSSVQSVPRAVILKAFEYLHSTELISPLRDEAGPGALKEYRLYRLMVTPAQVLEAVRQYKNLPTELGQWASSSLV